MYLASLELRDFRRYEEAQLSLGPGVTVLEGLNGAGKTTLLEAVAWAALGRSFRGVPDATLVRHGSEQAIVRAVVDDDGRHLSLDAELRVSGRNRVLVNGHPLARTRDRLELLRVTIFAPDDLSLVKGGPGERRTYLDDLLVVLAPRYEAARTDYDRVLRHRNALLKGGVRGDDATTTLDVFDDQLAAREPSWCEAGSASWSGSFLGSRVPTPNLPADPPPWWGTTKPNGPARQALDPDAIEERLRRALVELRRREIDRGITLAGPHRDEWRLVLNGLDTRSHASQGEQRCLALALRLAGHEVCRSTIGTAPVLLLDDVFSELDDQRAVALARALPEGQTLVSTASVLPERSPTRPPPAG